MRNLVEQHDKYNFEAKINYALDTRQKKNKFFLAFYFFIPQQLNVTSKSYSRADFYADMHRYIRFRNPRFTLEELLDTSNTRSPLYQIAAGIAGLRQSGASEELVRKIIYEMRMFGTCFKDFIKTEVLGFIRMIRQEPKSEGKDLDKKLEEFLGGLQKVIGQFDLLGVQLTGLNANQELRETRAFARDIISLELQNRLTLLLEVYRKRYKKASKQTAETLIRLIEEHQNFRLSHSSHLVRSAETLNEDFTYWEGILKKYFQGVLYLRLRDKDAAGKARHFFYGIAAGIAMFLSVILGYWIGMRFTSQQSMSFIIAIVAAYIVKDRIKDIIRIYSDSILRLFSPDRKFVIMDPLSGKNIGMVRETAHFLPLGDVPREVLQARSSGDMTLVKEKGKPEEVFVYHKVVSLDTKKISRNHTRHRDVDDIIRFNVRRLVEYADDSFHFDKIWDPHTKKIKRVKCAKVYHLNLIIRMETLVDQGTRKLHIASAREKKRIIFKHVRVILNQDGIVRMTEV